MIDGYLARFLCSVLQYFVSMLNKIQSNVQSMLTEARQIVNNRFSPNKPSPADYFLERAASKPSHIAKLRDDFSLDSKTKRAKTHIQTDYEIQTPAERKYEASYQQKSKSFRVNLQGSQVLALMPVQSELLSTRMYGLYKSKNAIKTIQVSKLPQISSKRSVLLGSNSLKQSPRHYKWKDLRKKSSLLKKIEGENGWASRGKKIRLREWLSESQIPENQNLNDIQTEELLQPWPSAPGQIQDFVH